MFPSVVVLVCLCCGSVVREKVLDYVVGWHIERKWWQLKMTIDNLFLIWKILNTLAKQAL